MASRVTYCATVVPGGENGNTRGVNVDGRAVVGERGESVAAVGSTDSVYGWLRCGRGVAGVLGLVTSGNSHKDTGRDDTSGRGVHRGRLVTSQRHVGNRTVRAVAGFDIVCDKIDAGDDTRVGTLNYNELGPFQEGSKAYRTAGVENLDGVEPGVLGNSIGIGSDGSSNVGTVTVAIGVGAITGIVGKEGSTASEVGMRGVDASVDDVGAGSSSRTRVIDVGG